jgi:cellulose biosynthesis protein BcsQ
MPFSDWNEFFNSGLVKFILALVGCVGTIGTAVWFFASLYYRGRIRNLKQQLAASEDHLDTATTTAQSQHAAAILKHADGQKATEILRLQRKLEVLLQRLAEAKDKEVKYNQAGYQLLLQRNQLRIDVAHHKELSDKLLSQVTDRDAQLETARLELDGRRSELDRSERRFRRAIRLNGFLWTAKALQRVPKFRPQAERRQAVISVLNLKGGVGKTTVAANLGAAFARRGQRVLFIDLDLQGSLTDLLLPLDKMKMLNANSALAQHFFEAASHDPKVKIADYAQELARFPETGGSVHLLGASDNLGYTELSLTLRWLLKQGQRDNRFLLRKALHLISVAKAYDIVIIDCPPLINISCINALAASDHVLIPVTLDDRAMDRVPVLLKRVLRSEKFRKSVNCDLKVLGLVANRTHRDQLNRGEVAQWNKLATLCRDALGEDVRRFETAVPNSNELRDSEGLLSAEATDLKAAGIFAALAAEIEKELPSECRRLAAAVS